jgi:hypothetical protein
MSAPAPVVLCTGCDNEALGPALVTCPNCATPFFQLVCKDCLPVEVSPNYAVFPFYMANHFCEPCHTQCCKGGIQAGR